jgi:general secretion pathway protein D
MFQEEDDGPKEKTGRDGRRPMKRSGWPFGHAILAIFLLAAATTAAVEIAPLPHRAIDRIEGGVPAEPPGTDGNGQGLPPPSVDGGGTAPGAQGAPPSQGGTPATVSTPLPPPAPAAGGEGTVVPPSPPPPPVTAIPPPLPSASPAVATPPPPLAATAPAPASSPVRPPSPASGAGPGFFVKFNNADIYEVIHTLGRTAGINYLIDPRVRGVVNLHTQGVVRKEGALDLLFAILRVNGATAIKEGETYHIVPMGEAKMEPLLPTFPGDNAAKTSSNQVIMRAFPLQYIGVADMAKVIKPFLSAGAEAVEVARANILLVTDTTANLEKTARLVELFDSEVFRTSGMKLFRLKVLDPEEMAKNLENIFGALDFSARGAKPAGINFVPIPRLYSLLVVSASPKTMEDVEKWIGELDRTGGGASRSVYRYRVKYGKVKDVAAVLEKLYPRKTASLAADKATEFKPAVSQLPGQASFPSQTPPAGPPGGAVAAAKTAKGETEVSSHPFDIIPDEPTNSLILRASLSEYADVLEILKAVDVYPQQVLLEVLVGEVNLKDDLRLGIDWTWTNSSGTTTQTATLSPGALPGLNNFSYLIEKTGRLTAAFRSLAEDGRASVISSPSVIATNGKKSKINVVDQIPITTSILNSATNPPVTTTTVEYRDVGVILSFTPFINDLGLVTLEIEQEVSDVDKLTPGSNPTFFKRSISTNLIASQDQSIVLGGLVKERKSLDRSGLPWFYKIPVFGWIFGSRTDSVSRNELLIFITPRVIRSVEEGIQLSRDFEERVAQLKLRMKEAQGIRLKVQPVLPVPDPTSGIPPAKAPPQ